MWTYNEVFYETITIQSFMFTAIVNSKATSKLVESWPVCTSPLIKSIIASQILSEKKKKIG